MRGHGNEPKKRNALGKALQLLRWMIDTSESGDKLQWGVREIGEALQMPPASVHRLLAALVEQGWVTQSPDSGQYQIGAEFHRLGLQLSSRFPIRSVGIPIMQDLVAACKETALLGLYDSSRLEMLFIASVNSPYPLRYVMRLNEWIPVYAGASGMAIMAFLPESERRAIIQRGLKPITRNTITNAEVLEKELDQVRLRGWARSNGHRNLGTIAFGAPIWGPEGRVIGSLLLTLPEARFDPRSERTLVRQVVHHASRITERLGGRRPKAVRPAFKHSREP